MPARNPLIGAAELAGALASAAPPVLLDVRWQVSTGPDRAGYEAGHLPGACFADLDRDLAAPPGAGRHPLPERAAFEAAMRRCGVRADRMVVAYDQADAVNAARAWWLLGWFGHPDARVLDGGLAAWVAAGLPLETGAGHPEPGDFSAKPGGSGGRQVVDAAGAAALASGGGVLLDARAASRYRGEVEPVDPVAGHIPGALSAPATGNVDERGRLLDPAALRERFEALGVRDDRPVGAYCGSGVAAAQEILALELAGFEAALYAGSWSDWITDPSRPVATGGSPA